MAEEEEIEAGLSAAEMEDMTNALNATVAEYKEEDN